MTGGRGTSPGQSFLSVMDQLSERDREDGDDSHVERQNRCHKYIVHSL